jgi:transcriptional regulator with XRE-family HTH domain
MQATKKLKLARALAGMRQIDLAKKAGISRGMISHIERGRRRLQPYLAKKLERILKIRLSSDE